MADSARTRKRSRPTTAGEASQGSTKLRWADASAVLSAAQQLEAAGPIRLAERLTREANAERLFRDRWASRVPVLSKTAGPEALCALLLELVEEEGTEILESPSFRDEIRSLVRRRYDYRGQDPWPGDRIAAALFGQRKQEDGRPPFYLDKVFDDEKRADIETRHEALTRCMKELPRQLVEPGEIQAELIARDFRFKLPEPRTRPPDGWREERSTRFHACHLPELALQISEHRKGPTRKRALDLKLRATMWALDSWPVERRYGAFSSWPKGAATKAIAEVNEALAEKESERLRGKGRLRIKPNRRT